MSIREVTYTVSPISASLLLAALGYRILLCALSSRNQIIHRADVAGENGSNSVIANQKLPVTSFQRQYNSSNDASSPRRELRLAGIRRDKCASRREI